MANLKNSQRISYKATYNQISPTATTGKAGKNPTKSLSRAVEKTAFIQSLRIIPAELAVLKKQLSDSRKLASGVSSQIAPVFTAIEKLISDNSASSTLNNASLFAKIDSETLVAVAQQLVTYRQSLVDRINRSIANILSAFRNSLVPPAPPPAAVATAAPEAALKTETKTASVTNSGISVVTTVTPVEPKKTGTKSKVESRGYTTQVTLDESKPAPPAFSSVLSMGPSTTYAPSNTNALAWAERFQPKLFASLADQIQPYLGVSVDEQSAMGGANAVAEMMRTNFAAIFNPGALQGVINGFQSRMAIEPVGNLHLERIEMYPAGVERGELVHSIPLAPAETVNISHKEWSITEKEFEDIVEDYFEGYSEQGVADKTDISMSNDSQSQHATALNVGASLSASYSSVTLSTNFGYNSTSNDSQSKKDSRNHSMSITKKASARTKKDHKVTFKVTSVAGSEDQSVRVISNPSSTNSMRIDYFQLARKWKVDLLRYGLRMTYDIVIPNPGSGIVTLVSDVKALDALINTPFTFTLPLSAIYYNSLAANPQDVSNYDQLAAQYDASVTAPPEPRKWVNVHKETAEVNDYDHVHFDSVEFDIDDNYYIYEFQLEFNFQTNTGETNDYFLMIGGESINQGITNLIGKSGHLSLDFMYQYIYNYAINITFSCRPKVQGLLDWRLQAWNQIRQAAEDAYNKGLQNYKDEQAKLVQQIADYDALTLRRMEQEEIMKGVLRWLLGPQFYLVPFNIASLFGTDSNDPEVTDVLDPNSLTASEWLDVMEHGEFIKYIHNAIEWENVLYFTYPYFWDDNKAWDFKKFLYHPDPTHRTFLRAGAARVVLTIRPGFEPSFTSLVESGAFNSLPGPHPYVTIAQEIQDFANTNYPGFPPANPEQDARPLLYLEQRRVWKEMQFIIQLLNAYKAATGAFPPDGGLNTVPVAALTPYLDGPIVINGTNYNGVNDYNTQANNQQLALDPNTPQEALLPTYAAVPANDLVWNNPYFYKCPGDTGDYDLISYGADGVPGGTDKNADISANSEASLISTWFEYTPTSAMDIGITTNPPNAVPPQPDPEIA
jgi:type II secretion system (T2SS) protein G